MTSIDVTSTPTPTDPELPKKLQQWLYVVGGVVATAAIIGLLVPAEFKWLPGIAGALTVFAGVFITARKSMAESKLRQESAEQERLARDAAKRERERSAILFGYNLREVLDSIDGLAAQLPAQRALEAPAVRHSVAVQTKEGVAALSSRAAYFRVDDLISPQRSMRPDKVASSPDRHDRFTSVFAEGETSNADIWDILDGQRQALLVVDVPEWESARNDEADREYGSFITARVEAGGIAFGLLTVNALAVGSLLADDLVYVEALARILGVVELLSLTSQQYSAARKAAASRTNPVSGARRTLHLDQGGPL